MLWTWNSNCFHVPRPLPRFQLSRWLVAHWHHRRLLLRSRSSISSSSLLACSRWSFQTSLMWDRLHVIHHPSQAKVSLTRLEDYLNVPDSNPDAVKSFIDDKSSISLFFHSFVINFDILNRGTPENLFSCLSAQAWACVPGTRHSDGVKPFSRNRSRTSQRRLLRLPKVRGELSFHDWIFGILLLHLLIGFSTSGWWT